MAQEKPKLIIPAINLKRNLEPTKSSSLSDSFDSQRTPKNTIKDSSDSCSISLKDQTYEDVNLTIEVSDSRSSSDAKNDDDCYQHHF